MVKNLPGKQETRVGSWVGKIPWRRKWQPTPVFWLRKSDGQRTLLGYNPWGHTELVTTEHTGALTLNIFNYVLDAYYMPGYLKITFQIL